MDAGLSYLHHLPILARRPIPIGAAHEQVVSRCTPCVLEPADVWTISARHGWQPSLEAVRGAAPSQAPRPKQMLYRPLRITIREAPSPSYRPPQSWLGRGQASAPPSPGVESPLSPPRVETSWEVFEYLAGLDFAAGIPLPELNLGKRLAKRLLRHSHHNLGQGLKVFYMAVGDTALAACPPAAADPAKLTLHASLATALLRHPVAAADLAVKRALFASKPRGRPGLLHSTNAERVAGWAPDTVGGTRLVAQRTPRAPRAALCFVLEPSEHYGHGCHHNALFEQVATFHANVLYLAGHDAPIIASSEQMRPLVERIEALRRDQARGVMASPQSY